MLPRVVVSVEQKAVGSSRITAISTTANRVDQRVQIRLSASSVDQHEPPHVFSVTVEDSSTGKAALLGSHEHIQNTILYMFILFNIIIII